MAGVFTRADLHDGPGKEDLPESLQEADRDDTVCKYCGVAYLVFSEVKELERQLKAAQAELALCKSKAEQYDSMRTELRAAQDEARKARAAVAEAQEELETALRRQKEEKEDFERQRAEGDARWRRQLEEQKSRAEADKKRALEAKDIECQALVTRETLIARGNLMRLHEANGKVKEMAKVLSSQKRDLAKLREDVTSSRDDVVNLIEAVQNEARTMARIVKRHAEEAQLLTDERDDARRVGEGLQADNSRLQAELNAALEQVAALTADAASSSSQLQGELQAARAQLATSEQAREAEAAAAEAAAADLRRQLSELRAELAASHRRGEVLQGQLAQAGSQGASSEAALRAMRGGVEELKAQLRDQQARYEALKVAGDQRLQGMTLQAAEEARAASAREAMLRQQLEATMADATRLRGEAGEASRQAAATLAASQAEVGRLSSQVAAMGRDMQAAMADLQRERQGVAEARAEVDRLRGAEGEVARLRQELAQLQQGAGEAARLRQMLRERDEALRENEVESSTLLGQVSRLQDRVKELEVEAATYKQQLAEAATTTAKVTDLEGMERHLIKLSNQLRQKDQEISRLEATVHKECEEREYYMEKLQQLQHSLGMVMEQRGMKQHQQPQQQYPQAAPASSYRAPSPISARSSSATPSVAGSVAESVKSEGGVSTQWASRRGKGGANRGRRRPQRFR